MVYDCSFDKETLINRDYFTAENRYHGVQETADLMKEMAATYDEINVETLCVTPEDRDVLMYDIHKESPKYTVLVTGRIHGIENAGHEATLKLAEELVTDATVGATLDDVRYLMVPILNPDGAYHGRRGVIRKRAEKPHEIDLNRDYKYSYDLMEPETQAMVDVVEQYQPDLVIDLHEAGSSMDPFWIKSGQHPDPSLRTLEDAFVEWVGGSYDLYDEYNWYIHKEREGIYFVDDLGGLINYTEQRGIRSFAVEAPGQTSNPTTIGKRVDMDIKAIFSGIDGLMQDVPR